jgi:hypothetical protein
MPTSELEPLLAAPVEALDVEYKSWLDLRGNDEHKANLAKAAIALANEGGGFIILGIREQRPDLISEGRPPEIAPYDQDLLNGIIRRFASPPFHCALSLLRHPVTGHGHAVVRIPGGFGSPVMSRSGTAGNTIRPHLCYVRKPGPESAPPENPADWDRLLSRCLRNRREDMLDAIRHIVSGGESATAPAVDEVRKQDAFITSARGEWEALIKDLPADAPARCPLGRYEFDYALLGEFERPSLADLLGRLRQAVVRHTGWPEFWVPTREEIQPHPVGDAIQCWIGTPEMGARDSAHVDFWRVSPNGRAFLLRGFAEDSRLIKHIEPGAMIDITNPIWRVGECLLHAGNLGSTFVAHETLRVQLRARWYGLSGRSLGYFDSMQTFFMANTYATKEDSYLTETSVELSSISDNLPEIVHRFLLPFYERFSFYRLSIDTVAKELAKMRENRF